MTKEHPAADIFDLGCLHEAAASIEFVVAFGLAQYRWFLLTRGRIPALPAA
jgi:hypothetical protein